MKSKVEIVDTKDGKNVVVWTLENMQDFNELFPNGITEPGYDVRESVQD